MSRVQQLGDGAPESQAERANQAIVKVDGAVFRNLVEERAIHRSMLGEKHERDSRDEQYQ